MLRKKPLNWLFVGWLVAGLIDLFLPHPQNIVRADPISASILITLAIVAGSIGLQYLSTKKQKVAPVDRGKQDDIRISMPGYGEQIVKSWGQVRGAPVWIWHTPIVDRPLVTPGHSGGKGPPKPPTPTTTDHQYFTSVAGVFHDGPIVNVNRIWFGPDIVWNTTPQLSSTRYEAENATLAGTAVVIAATFASGSSGVTSIGNGAGNYVEFSVPITDSGDYDIAIFYQIDSATLDFEVWLDGVSQGIVTCAPSGPSLIATQTIGFAMTAGTRVIKFGNTSANAPNLDCIDIVETVSFATGTNTDARIFSDLIDPSIAPPTDQTKPWPTYNARPILGDDCPVGYHLNPDTGMCDPDTGGGGGGGGAGVPVTLTSNLAKWGQPQIRVYLGTTDQGADSAIIADKGVDNTPAWRGFAYLVIENIIIPNGALPNVTIEWDQGTTAVDQITKDLYALGGEPDSILELSALSGLTIPGVIRTSQKPIGDTLKDLQTRFQFDMIEVDGVVKGGLRNRTAIDFTIPFAKLRAHADGSETPPQDCVITDTDPLLLPLEVGVNYLSQAQDYHNAVQFDRRTDGVQYDVQSVSLALVDTEPHMKQLASTLLYKPDMEGRSFVFETGPEFFPVIPGSVGQLVLPNTTHTVRVGDGKYGLPVGICQFQAVRQAASLYSPTGFGSISGAETPIAGFPSNTKGIILDGPLLRPEDAGDGSQSVVYIGACGIGGGAWPGAYLYKEWPLNSGNYIYTETLFNKASAIGVTLGTLGSVTDATAWDRVASLTIDFYFDPLLSTASEADILMQSELNLLAIKNPSTGDVEYVQFATSTPGVASSPFVARYTVTNLLRGRLLTDDNVGSHTSADEVVFMDSTIKPRRFDVAELGR